MTVALLPALSGCFLLSQAKELGIWNTDVGYCPLCRAVFFYLINAEKEDVFVRLLPALSGCFLLPLGCCRCGCSCYRRYCALCRAVFFYPTAKATVKTKQHLVIARSVGLFSFIWESYSQVVKIKQVIARFVGLFSFYLLLYSLLSLCSLLWVIARFVGLFSFIEEYAENIFVEEKLLPAVLGCFLLSHSIGLGTTVPFCYCPLCRAVFFYLYYIYGGIRKWQSVIARSVVLF